LRPAKIAIAPVLLAFAGGLLLAALAAPQFWGGIKLLPQERTLANLAGGLFTQPVSDARLEDAVAAWRAAAPWLDSSDGWTGYGDVLMASARRSAADPALRRRRLEAADRAYREAIARDPANGRAWTMLTAAAVERGGTPETVLPLLRQAMRIGAHEPSLVFTRLDIAFYLWRVLDPALKAEAAKEVLSAARFDVDRFTRLVRRHYLLEPVRAILDSDPDLKWKFDDWYLRLYP
jgi:hypothetical protein